MRIHADINERTVRRKFTEPKHRKRPLTIIDHTLPAFSLRITADDTRTFFVRVKRRLNVDTLRLGTTAELTADEAERETGPLFRYFADEFMRRQGPCWKPATRASNRSALKNHILPLFGGMRVADIARADVQRWFDSMSGAPARANRALPVLSVMMPRAELWDLWPQGSNPCRNMRRYRTKPRERFLSLDELKRLGRALRALGGPSYSRSSGAYLRHRGRGDVGRPEAGGLNHGAQSR